MLIVDKKLSNIKAIRQKRNEDCSAYRETSSNNQNLQNFLNEDLAIETKRSITGKLNVLGKDEPAKSKTVT